MSSFYADKEITGYPDKPDLLNREDFAARIAKALLLDNRSDSVVVSIEGNWGSGKTSILNLIKKYYYEHKEKRPIIVDFNPWLIGDKDNLVQSFLVQFAATVDQAGKNKHYGNAAKSILNFSKILSDVVQRIPNLEPKSQAFAKIVSIVSHKSLILIEKLDEFDVNKSKEKVIKSLKNIYSPIVIFIDDVDRLPPEEVYTMVRILKAISDFPKIAFIIAFDPEYITKSLENYLVPDPDTYLDKIIQIRLNTPLFHRNDLNSIFDSELKKLALLEKLEQRFHEDVKRFSEVYHFGIKHLIETPRDIKRLFNRTKFSLQSTFGEVSFVDLICLDLLAIKAPSVYYHIKKYPFAYIGTDFETEISLTKKAFEVVKEQKPEREKILKDNPKKKYIETILKNLFPYIDEIHFNEGYYKSQGRVAIGDRLSIALSQGLPSYEIASNIILQFITDEKDRNEIIRNIIDSEKIERFSESLNDNIRNIELDKIANYQNLISNICPLTDTEKAEYTVLNYSIFQANIVRLLYWVIINILKKLEEKDKNEIVIEIISNPQTLTIGTEMFRDILSEDEEAKKKEIKDSERLFKAIDVVVISEKWKNSVKDIIESERFDQITGRYRIAKFLPFMDNKLAKKLYNSMIQTENGFDSLIKALSTGGQDSNKGHYVDISEEFLEKIFDIKMIREKAEIRLKKGNIKDKRFEAGLRSIISNKRLYISDFSDAERF